MNGDDRRWHRGFGGLVVTCVIAGFAVLGCSEIHPEPNVEEGGLLESPTHEADSLRRVEERQEQNRGGGSSY